jgi:hypothetical protein
MHMKPLQEVTASYCGHSLVTAFITATAMHAVLNTELWEWRAARTPCPAFVGQSCLLVTLPGAAQNNNNNNNSSSSSSSSSSSTYSKAEAQLTQEVGTQIDGATAAEEDDEAVVAAAAESKEVHMLAFFGGQVSCNIGRVTLTLSCYKQPIIHLCTL